MFFFGNRRGQTWLPHQRCHRYITNSCVPHQCTCPEWDVHVKLFEVQRSWCQICWYCMLQHGSQNKISQHFYRNFIPYFNASLCHFQWVLTFLHNNSINIMMSQKIRIYYTRYAPLYTWFVVQYLSFYLFSSENGWKMIYNHPIWSVWNVNLYPNKCTTNILNKWNELNKMMLWGFSQSRT